MLLATLALEREAGADDLKRWTQGPQPLFTLPAIDGTEVALASRRGSVVLVHFFATWCESCRDEWPALIRFSARAGAPVAVLAVAVADVDSRVRLLVQTAKPGFPVLLDRDRAAAKSWKVSTLPTTFVLDSQLAAKLFVETDYAWDALDPKALLDRVSPRTTNKLTQVLGGHDDARQ